MGCPHCWHSREAIRALHAPRGRIASRAAASAQRLARLYYGNYTSLFFGIRPCRAPHPSTSIRLIQRYRPARESRKKLLRNYFPTQPCTTRARKSFRFGDASYATDARHAWRPKYSSCLSCLPPSSMAQAMGSHTLPPLEEQPPSVTRHAHFSVSRGDATIRATSHVTFFHAWASRRHQRPSAISPPTRAQLLQGYKCETILPISSTSTPLCHAANSRPVDKPALSSGSAFAAAFISICRADRRRRRPASFRN